MISSLYISSSSSEAASGAFDIPVEVGVYPSVYKFDSDYYGVDLASGMDLRLGIRIADGIYFENLIGFYVNGISGESVQGFKDQIGVRVSLDDNPRFTPELLVGFSVLSANPPAETITRKFRPSQSAFYITAGIGASTYLSDSILFRSEVIISGTPYEYRVFSYDRNTVKEEGYYFLNLNLSFGISYIF